MSAKDSLVIDFDVYPTVGDAPLLVVVGMHKNGKIKKLAWDFGEGKIEENTKLISSHTYQKPGNYQGKVQAYDAHNDEFETHEFDINVKTPSAKNPLIGRVYQTNESGYAIQNQPVSFAVHIPEATTSSIDEIHWDFGDGVSQSSYKTPHTDHVFKQAGHFDPKVTVSVKGRGTDSKSCHILIFRS